MNFIQVKAKLNQIQKLVFTEIFKFHKVEKKRFMV